MNPRLVAPVLLACFACAPPKLDLPSTVICAKTVTAGPSFASLQSALAGATAGDCVVAAASTYQGELTVPAGVVLAAEQGTVVELQGGTATVPTVTLGAGSTLSGLTLSDSAGIGVSGAPGVHLIDVAVQRAAMAGGVFWCEEDCRVADPAELRDCRFTDGAIGLVVHGARVSLTGGRIAGSASQALASGYGLVASHGADLQMAGTVVEDNQELGVLLDGALDTTASLTGVTVQNNRGRGLWAQGLLGSASAPKLTLTDCTVTANRLVGIGAKRSRGISIQGGRVASTRLAQTSSGTPGVLIDVGDGLGLFEDSGDVALTGVTLAANERSQALIDRGSTGLQLTGATVMATGTQQGVVVQRTTEPVQAPMSTTPPPGQELPISAPSLALPSR